MMRRFAVALLATAVLAPAGASQAEQAWIKDEVTVWVRSGPGSNFRNFRSVKTGDSVEIVSRGENWTQVRIGEVEGWIPIGFLQAEPPARIQLERYERDTQDRRSQLASLTTEVEELRARSDAWQEQERSFQTEIQRLRDENIELRAGARWPEWIAGASILVMGGLLGIFVHWSTSRRGTRRIRL